MAGKREWFVAVCPMDGMHAGNPPALDVDTDIYGPYTHEQAKQAEAIGEEAPDETFTVVIFRADARPPHRTLLKMLRATLQNAQTEDDEEDDE